MGKNRAGREEDSGEGNQGIVTRELDTVGVELDTDLEQRVSPASVNNTEL